MRAAARVRGFPGVVVGLVLAIPLPGHAITVVASVSPGTVVPLGTVVTLTATITNDNGSFGTLCPVPTLATQGCSMGVCATPDGLYAISPDDILIFADAVSVTPTLPFTYTFNQTALVVWQFTATRTGTTSFSLVAHDNTGVSEGCGDPSADASCPPNFGFISNPSTCGFVTVTVTSTLTGRANAYVVAPTTRPANTAYPDDTIAVVMSATNTGVTLINLNAGVSSTRVGTTARLTPAAAPAFPVGIAGGNSAFLTWTWSVNGDSPTASTVTFATDVERTLAISNALTITAAPITMTATLLLDPDGAGVLYATSFAGSTYFIIDDEIHVVATIANLGGSSLDLDPVVVLPDAFTNGTPDVFASAPRSPAGVQIVGSLTSRTFTWKYRINRDDLYQNCLFTPPPMEFRVRTRGIEIAKLLDVLRDAVSIAPSAPNAVTVGMPFTATLWLTNVTGRAIELDASATVFFTSDDPAKAAVFAGPVPQGTRLFAPGESLPYVFTVSATAQGSAPLRGGILYPGGAIPSSPCYNGPTAYVEIGDPSPLDAVLISSTTIVNIGEAYGLTLTITNSTTCPAELDSVGPVLEYPYNASFVSQLSTDCASYPCPVPALGSVTIRFTVTPNECGEVDWAGTETGRWSGCGNAPFSRPFDSPTIHVRRPAALADPGSVTWALSKLSAVEGQTFDLIATVIPAGENDLTSFALSPAIHLSAGAAVSVQSVPGVPGTLPGCGTCVTNICPAKAQSFTWTFRADSKGSAQGKVWFTITATGQDPYSGSPAFSSTTTGMLSILKPSSLLINTVFIDADAGGGFLPGCQIPVTVCLMVDGDTQVSTTTFLPGAGVTPTPAGLAVPSSAPFPAIPALLNPGQNFFTWTFSPVGAGTVNFTVSGVGTEVTYGTTTYAVGTTTGGRLLTPAAMTASGYANASVITTAAGQTVSVFVTARNTGDVPIVGFTATASAQQTACGAFPAQSPRFAFATYPDVSVPLVGCGDTMTFIWTFSATATGAGIVVFTATLTAQDSETAAVLTSAILTTCVTILPRGPLVASVIQGSATIVQGADLNVTVRLDNQGATPLNVFPGSQILAANSTDLIPVPPPPPGAVTIPANSIMDVTARISAKGSAAPGPVQITVTPTAFTATDASTKAPVPMVVGGGPITVTVVPPAPAAPPGVTVSENPWHPLGGKLALTWGEPDGGEVTLRVLTIGGETVKTLMTGTAPGTSGIILWDGTNESGQTLAAGIYLIRWESVGKKQTRKLAVVK